jgi:hypothetical protein
MLRSIGSIFQQLGCLITFWGECAACFNYIGVSVRKMCVKDIPVKRFIQPLSHLFKTAFSVNLPRLTHFTNNILLKNYHFHPGGWEISIELEQNCKAHIPLNLFRQYHTAVGAVCNTWQQAYKCRRFCWTGLGYC